MFAFAMCLLDKLYSKSTNGDDTIFQWTQDIICLCINPVLEWYNSLASLEFIVLSGILPHVSKTKSHTKIRLCFPFE